MLCRIESSWRMAFCVPSDIMKTVDILDKTSGGCQYDQPSGHHPKHPPRALLANVGFEKIR